MTIDQVIEHLRQTIGESCILSTTLTPLQNTLEINADNLVASCQALQRLYFDQLACITGLDFPKENTIELVYNLYAITQNLGVALKIRLVRNPANGLPTVQTLSNLWGTANWHEREIYDLLGVSFEGHPDLRRILMPADWEGYPLRKDYVPQEKYHSIHVKYQ